MIVNINGRCLLTDQKPVAPIDHIVGFNDMVKGKKSWSKFPKFIEITEEPMVTMQIKPDRTARNWNADDLARALHELHVLPNKRFSLTSQHIRYRMQENLTFDITFEHNSIRFWLTVPERWENYAKGKLQTLWPKATIQVGKAPLLDSTKATCSVLGLKQHNLFSLAVAKNDNRPLNSLLEVSKDIKEGDFARVQIVAIPKDRQIWEYEATRIAKKHRAGDKPKRNNLNPANIVEIVFQLLDKAFSEIAEMLAGITSKEDTPKFSSKDPDNLLALFLEKNNRELKEATIGKINAPIFEGIIRIAAQSTDDKKAGYLVKSIANAYGDLAAENEFKRRDLKGKPAINEISLMNNHQVPSLRLSYSMFSHAELGKMLQIPGSEL